MRALVFLHKLHQQLVVAHRLGYLRLDVLEVLLEIIHAEVVEQVLGLLAQVVDSVLLFGTQLVGILLLVVGGCLLLVEHAILVDTEVGGYARDVDVLVMDEELLGVEILVGTMGHSLRQDFCEQRIGKTQSVDTKIVVDILRYVEIHR